MRYKLFLKLSLFAVFLLPICVFIFNFLIDPFNWNGTNYLNLNKPHLSYDRFSKIGMSDNEEFEIINIGMSSSQKINPKIIEEYRKKVAYNFAMTGSTPYEQKILLEYILKDHKLNTVLIAIDEFSYHNSPSSLLTRDFPIERFERNFPLYLKYYFRPMMIRQSLKTILFNLKKQTQGHGILEYHGMENWELEKIAKIAMDYKNEIYKDVISLGKKHKNNAGFFDNNLKVYEEMIDITIASGVENVIVYFPPQHADKLRYQKKYLNQYYNKMLEFKKKLLQISKSKTFDIKVYDLLFVNQITDNSLYFWDTKHLKNKFDDMVIKSILEGCNDYICIELNKNNIDYIITETNELVSDFIEK